MDLEGRDEEVGQEGRGDHHRTKAYGDDGILLDRRRKVRIRLDDRWSAQEDDEAAGTGGAAEDEQRRPDNVLLRLRVALCPRACEEADGAVTKSKLEIGKVSADQRNQRKNAGRLMARAYAADTAS